MSPEQAELERLDIDTRTRHLLAGRAALRAHWRAPCRSTPQRLRRAGYRRDAADHPRGGAAAAEHPGQRARSDGDGGRGAPADRPGELVRLLRGELDWIVMKALEKDRDAPLRDRQRAWPWTSSATWPTRPSRPARRSARYRLGKLVRRHRLLFGGRGAVVFAGRPGRRRSRARSSTGGPRQPAGTRVASSCMSTSPRGMRARGRRRPPRRAPLARPRPEPRRGGGPRTDDVHRRRIGAVLSQFRASWASGPRGDGCTRPSAPMAARSPEVVKTTPATSGASPAARRSRRPFPKETVSVVRFSPDGRYIATGSEDGSAAIWDAATGRRLTLALPRGVPSTSIAFSPDGRRLATASDDRTARLWETPTGRPLFIWRHDGTVREVAFAREGSAVVSAGGDGTYAPGTSRRASRSSRQSILRRSSSG